MISPANPAALLAPGGQVSGHRPAKSRWWPRLAIAGIVTGIIVLGTGLALSGTAARTADWLHVLSYLSITAVGLCLIFVGSVALAALYSSSRSNRHHGDVRDALAELSGKMVTEFGDLHREVRLIEQRQTEFDHHMDKMDERQDDLDRAQARTVAEVHRLRREVAELVERVPAKPARQPRQRPRRREDPPAFPPKKYMTDVAEAYRLGQQMRPPDDQPA